MFGSKNTLGILPIVWAGWFVGFFFVRLSPPPPRQFPQHALLKLCRGRPLRLVFIRSRAERKTSIHTGRQHIMQVLCPLLGSCSRLVYARYIQSTSL
jgi:hypothetical protein